MEERRMNEGVEEREREREEEFQTSAALRWRAPSPAPGQPFIEDYNVCIQNRGQHVELFSIIEKKGNANSYLPIHSIPLQPARIGNQTPNLSYQYTQAKTTQREIPN